MMLRILSLVLLLGVLGTGCRTGRTPSRGLVLTEAHLIERLGFSINYPSGWMAKTSIVPHGTTTMSTTFISQTDADQQKPFFAVKSYQVAMIAYGVDHLQKAHALPEKASLQDLYVVIAREWAFFASGDPSETSVNGAPALRVRGKVLGREDRPMDCLVAFVRDQGSALCATAPPDQNLDQFISIWEQMLKSIKSSR